MRMTYTFKLVEDVSEKVVAVIPSLPYGAAVALLGIVKAAMEAGSGQEVSIHEVEDAEGKGITREQLRVELEKLQQR